MSDTFRLAPVVTLTHEQVRARFEHPASVVTREQWASGEVWTGCVLQSIRDATGLDSLAASARAVVAHG